MILQRLTETSLRSKSAEQNRLEKTVFLFLSHRHQVSEINSGLVSQGGVGELELRSDFASFARNLTMIVVVDRQL